MYNIIIILLCLYILNTKTEICTDLHHNIVSTLRILGDTHITYIKLITVECFDQGTY